MLYSWKNQILFLNYGELLGTQKYLYRILFLLFLVSISLISSNESWILSRNYLFSFNYNSRYLGD